MIQLKHVSLFFGSRPLFRDLSLEVPAGGRLLIRGASGSGKTSLLRLILGFRRPDSGEVILDDTPLNVRTVWEMRRRMAYVSQEVELGRGSVEAFFREAFSFRGNRDLVYEKQDAVTLLEEFGLDASTLGAELETLSGGERQRIAIIMTLLLKRDIYLLDEITSALDQELKTRISAYFSRLKKVTLVVASHDKVWHGQGFQTIDL
ncbi:MAG: ABC transporter ATP-binding protein [Bacteroidales bacterium]